MRDLFLESEAAEPVQPDPAPALRAGVSAKLSRNVSWRGLQQASRLGGRVIADPIGTMHAPKIHCGAVPPKASLRGAPTRLRSNPDASFGKTVADEAVQRGVARAEALGHTSVMRGFAKIAGKGVWRPGLSRPVERDVLAGPALRLRARALA